MSDYEGLSRVVIVKKKKNDPLGFKLKYDTERKGNVSKNYQISFLIFYSAFPSSPKVKPPPMPVFK